MTGNPYTARFRILWPLGLVLFGIVIWITVVGALRLMAKADPMMRQVYLRHIRYQQTYRPTSSPWRRS